MCFIHTCLFPFHTFTPVSFHTQAEYAIPEQFKTIFDSKRRGLQTVANDAVA